MNAPKRALTLVEVAVAMTVFLIVAAGMASLVGSTATSSNVVLTSTDVQVDAERILAEVRRELSLTGAGSSSPGNLVVTGGPAPPVEIAYNVIDQGDIFDETAPNPAQSVPWKPDRFFLSFEAEPGEDPTNGLDDDGDFLVDEVRLALYRQPPAGARSLIKVVGEGLVDVQVETTGGTLPGRERVHVRFARERVQRHLIASNADLAAAQAGGGPRVRHTVDVYITPPN